MPFAFTVRRGCINHSPTQDVTFRGHGLYFLGLQDNWRQDGSTRKGMGSFFTLSYMSNVILPEGWDDWVDSSRQSSVFYSEYKCYGAKKRVVWSKELTGVEAEPFLTKNMIAGKSWTRSTPSRFKKFSSNIAISN